MKNRIVLLLVVSAVIGAIFSSCSVHYLAKYDIGLNQVEKPANSKLQFGGTKIDDFREGAVVKHRYEDDFINIVWVVDAKSFSFELINKSDYSLKIIWDDCSFVDIQGQSHRVMHSGVKYINRNESQPPTTIPKGAALSDVLIPTDNVFWYSQGWDLKGYLFPMMYKTTYDLGLTAKTLVGEKMKVLLPIVIEGVQNEYTFTFSIDNWAGMKIVK